MALNKEALIKDMKAENGQDKLKLICFIFLSTIFFKCRILNKPPKFDNYTFSNHSYKVVVDKDSLKLFTELNKLRIELNLGNSVQQYVEDSIYIRNKIVKFSKETIHIGDAIISISNDGSNICMSSPMKYYYYDSSVDSIWFDWFILGKGVNCKFFHLENDLVIKLTSIFNSNFSFEKKADTLKCSGNISIQYAEYKKDSLSLSNKILAPICIKLIPLYSDGSK